MRNYSRLVVGISILFLLVIGVGLCGEGWGIKEISISRWLSEIELTTIRAVGAALLILVLLALSSAIKNLKYEPTIAFKSAKGETRVAFNAIEDLVKKMSLEMSEVKEMKPRVVVTKKGLEIYNKISLSADVNIPRATERIQENIKKHVEDVLGIEIASIRILVAKIQPEKKISGGSAETPAPPKVEYR